jgi:hypothetical protein
MISICVLPFVFEARNRSMQMSDAGPGKCVALRASARLKLNRINGHQRFGWFSAGEVIEFSAPVSDSLERNVRRRT